MTALPPPIPRVGTVGVLGGPRPRRIRPARSRLGQRQTAQGAGRSRGGNSRLRRCTAARGKRRRNPSRMGTSPISKAQRRRPEIRGSRSGTLLLFSCKRAAETPSAAILALLHQIDPFGGSVFAGLGRHHTTDIQIKAPVYDPAWSEVKTLYRHDIQEIWDPTINRHIWNQYHNQLDT